LEQITRYETRGDAELAEYLDEQPARVAARARALAQRLFGRLHTGFEPDQVADVALDSLVELDEEVDRPARRQVDAVDERLEQGRRVALDQVGREFVGELGLISEGKRFGRRLEKEVEGVVDRHFGNEVDRDLEFASFLG